MKKEKHKRNSFRLLAMHHIQSGKSLIEVSKLAKMDLMEFLNHKELEHLEK